MTGKKKKKYGNNNNKGEFESLIAHFLSDVRLTTSVTLFFHEMACQERGSDGF